MNDYTRTQLEKTFPTIYKAIIKTTLELKANWAGYCAFSMPDILGDSLTVYFKATEMSMINLAHFTRTRKLKHIGVGIDGRLFITFSVKGSN